jgi:hypothetical protein
MFGGSFAKDKQIFNGVPYGVYQSLLLQLLNQRRAYIHLRY